MPRALAGNHQALGTQPIQGVDHRGLAHIHQVRKLANGRQAGAVGQAALVDRHRQLIDDLLHQRYAGLEFDGRDDCALNLHFTGLSGSKVRSILYELALIKTSVSLYHHLTVFPDCRRFLLAQSFGSRGVA